MLKQKKLITREENKKHQRMKKGNEKTMEKKRERIRTEEEGTRHDKRREGEYHASKTCTFSLV